MEFDEVVRSRRMVRSYDPDAPVPDAVVRALVAAAARAPSAGFAQGFDVVVLRSAADRALFWCTTAPGGGGDGDPGGGPGSAWLAGMRTAPLLLVVLSDPGAYARRYAAPDKARAATEGARDGARPEDAVPWWDVDAGMAALLVLLTAVDAGLGACLFGVPPERHVALREALGVPAGRRVLGAVSVGTPAPHPTRGDAPPAASPHRPARRAASAVGHDGRYGVPLV